MTTDCTRILLAEAIEASTLSRKEIAARLGFKKENVLSMMLQGLTRVPLYLVPRLAGVLEIDERLFVVTAIEEYHPELLEKLARLGSISREDAELGLLTMCRMADARIASDVLMPACRKPE